MTKPVAVQGLSGSAQRYVRFLLASTAGYKEAMPHRNGSLHCPEPSRQQSAAQPPAAQDLHIHFMSHCEHHMLPFHGQASIATGSSYHTNPGLTAQPLKACCASGAACALPQHMRTGHAGLCFRRFAMSQMAVVVCGVRSETVRLKPCRGCCRCMLHTCSAAAATMCH